MSFRQRSKSRRRMSNFPLGLHLSGGRRCNFLYNLFADRIQCVSKRQRQSFPLLGRASFEQCLDRAEVNSELLQIPFWLRRL